MKGKILGLLAVGLLAGPMAANASYIYSAYSNNNLGFPVGVATWTVDSLITTNTTVSSFDSNSIAELASISFDFAADVRLIFTTTGALSSPITAPTGPGTYCNPYVGCEEHTPYLTIERSTSVPEPGTLALLGIGLAGLGLTRRRQAD